MSKPEEQSKFPYMEIATAMGFIAMFCSDLEWALDSVFGFLFRLTPEESLAIGGDITAAARVALLNKAVEIWKGKPEMKEKFISFVNEYDRLKNLRNTLVHGLWYPPKEGGKHHLLIKFKARDKVSASIQECSPKYLYGIAQEILDLQKEIQDFFDSNSELPNWKTISRNAPMWAFYYSALRDKHREQG